MIKFSVLTAGWSSYFLVFGMWDTATTAVMVGVGLGIATIWATASPGSRKLVSMPRT